MSALMRIDQGLSDLCARELEYAVKHYSLNVTWTIKQQNYFSRESLSQRPQPQLSFKPSSIRLKLKVVNLQINAGSRSFARWCNVTTTPRKLCQYPQYLLTKYSGNCRYLTRAIEHHRPNGYNSLWLPSIAYYFVVWLDLMKQTTSVKVMEVNT